MTGFRKVRVLATLGVALLPSGACRSAPDRAVAERSAQRAAEHVEAGRAAIDRLGRGLLTALERGAGGVAASFAAPVEEARVRTAVRGLRDDQTEGGRELSFYPTAFLVGIGMEGRAVARDLPADQDLMRGMDLAGTFPCVRGALAGTGALCTGEMPAAPGQTSRVYLFAVAPVKRDGGVVVGAVAGAISFGNVARAVRRELDTRTAREQKQLYVGLIHGDRVLPSGRDTDVPAAYLVPPALLRHVPATPRARIAAGGGALRFTFDENEGSQQWGAAAGALPGLGAEDALLVYRTELRP